MCELLPADDAPRPACKGLRNVPCRPHRPRTSILAAPLRSRPASAGHAGRQPMRCETPLRPSRGWRGVGRSWWAGMPGRLGAVDPELREALRLRPPDVGRPAELLEDPDDPG